MNKILYVIFILFFLNLNFTNAEIISGKIHHDDMNIKNQIIDFDTQKPISKAKITIPEINYTTYTDENGTFKLNANVNSKTALIVEKDGYKVFSLTVDNNVLRKPLKLGIEKSNMFDLQISQGLIHLGDNMFSSNSANSSDFRLNAKGPYLSQKFKKPQINQKQHVVLKIGTIIGLDTQKAKTLGQNKISKVYSSPMEVYINGNIIAYIELNQDDLELELPLGALKEDNELVIKTGRNLFQYEYVDYDDCELANIRIEVKEKGYFARNK